MRRIPGPIAAAVAIGKADLRGWALVATNGVQAFVGANRPIPAGMVNIIRVGAAIRLRAGQHFVPVGIGVLGGIRPGSIFGIRIVIQTRHDFALFRQRRQLVDVVVHAREIERVAMQVERDRERSFLPWRCTRAPARSGRAR